MSPRLLDGTGKGQTEVEGAESRNEKGEDGETGGSIRVESKGGALKGGSISTPVRQKRKSRERKSTLEGTGRRYVVVLVWRP